MAHDTVVDGAESSYDRRMPTFRFERTCDVQPVAGIDEAGRGPLAGPVIAAAVVLDAARLPRRIARRINDSKQLAAAEREELFDLVRPYAAIGVGGASVTEIDRINILRATYVAMRRAVTRLPLCPAIALVDGNGAPDLPCAVRTIVDGDRLSLSIAAASIVAKVTRDRLMRLLARQHPGYGWEHNAGYGTEEHRDALLRLGLTRHHRRSFRPVAQILAPFAGPIEQMQLPMTDEWAPLEHQN
jgi:ribonuclease HII